MKENQFQDIELKTREIFEKALVKVVKIDNPELRHIYIRYHLQGEQLLALEKLYRILFVTQVYEEENKQEKMDAYQVIVICEIENHVNVSSLIGKEILKNTSDDELFSLFGEFLNRLFEKTKGAGICDDSEPIFQVIKDMKSK